MDNLYDGANNNSLFKQFKVSDLLFTEYKCLEEASIFKTWSHHNYFVYVGIAEKAVKIVMDSIKNQKDKNPLHAILTGDVFNKLRTAQITWRDMVRLTNNFEFKPTDEMGNEMLIRKSLVANATAATVSKAMEITGGKGYFRKFPLEKLLRDVQA